MTVFRRLRYVYYIPKDSLKCLAAENEKLPLVCLFIFETTLIALCNTTLIFKTLSNLSIGNKLEIFLENKG